MDCVPMRMPLGNLQEAKEQVELITAPDMTVPDYYLTILQETGYEFSLEKWVLTGLQGGYAAPPGQPKPPVLRCSSSSSSEAQPSCPPYWMMFSSPQQSRLASRHHSDFWEPNPRQRSHSLDPKDPRTAVNFARSDSSGDDGEKSPAAAEKTKTFLLPAKEASLPYSLGGGGGGAGGGPTVPASCQLPGLRRAQSRAFTPDLLNPPTCLSSLPHQRRKNLRQCSLSGSLDASGEGGQKKTNRGAEHTQAPTAQRKATQAPTAQKARPPTTRANTVSGVADIKHSNKLSLSPYYSSCSATPSRRPLGSHTAAAAPLQPDWSVELLSALSPEERALLRAVTDRGYPLREAIVALQRTGGQQSPEQILSYMLACERLCELGYDEAQVEEALEMFQNCETKAKEFLHLLRQFNEMGFQQNAIKEVLLVHDNHWERALEELMMHS